MRTPCQDLRQLVTELQEKRDQLIRDYQLDRAREMTYLIKKVDQITKRLAAGSDPVKVLIAVYDHTVEVMASTASVKVVSVDHRSQAGQRLHVGMAPAMAIPSEFIEAVSDEAAEYLYRCKADQLSVLSQL